MTAPQIVFLCTDREANNPIPFKDIEGLTVEEIKKNVSKTDLPLWIHTPKFLRQLEPTEILSKSFPKLAMTRSELYTRPDFYLYLNPPYLPTQFVVYCDILHTSEMIIPKLPVIVNKLTLKEKTVTDFLLDAQNSFGLPMTTQELLLNGSHAKKGTHLLPIFKLINKLSISIVCTFSDEAIRKMRQRVLVSEEVISTEETYLADLLKLISFWKPKLLSMNQELFFEISK